MKSKIDLVNAFKKMHNAKDVIKDTHGNVSVVNRGEGLIYIKPSGMAYDEITLDDVCMVSLEDGKSIMGSKRKPSVDTEHHRSIYNSYPHINAICHTHSPYATAFAMAGSHIDVYCTEHADYFGHYIHCGQYSDLNNWGKNIFIRSDERAVLLGKHGALTFSTNAEHAVDLAIALENIAQKTFLFEQLAPEDSRECLKDAEIKKWHERYNTTYGQ